MAGTPSLHPLGPEKSPSTTLLTVAPCVVLHAETAKKLRVGREHHVLMQVDNIPGRKDIDFFHTLQNKGIFPHSSCTFFISTLIIALGTTGLDFPMNPSEMLGISLEDISGQQNQLLSQQGPVQTWGHPR